MAILSKSYHHLIFIATDPACTPQSYHRRDDLGLCLDSILESTSDGCTKQFEFVQPSPPCIPSIPFHFESDLSTTMCIAFILFRWQRIVLVGMPKRKRQHQSATITNQDSVPELYDPRLSQQFLPMRAAALAADATARSADSASPFTASSSRKRIL